MGEHHHRQNRYGRIFSFKKIKRLTMKLNFMTFKILRTTGFSNIDFSTYETQGRHGEFDPDKAYSTAVGII